MARRPVGRELSVNCIEKVFASYHRDRSKDCTDSYERLVSHMRKLGVQVLFSGMGRVDRGRNQQIRIKQHTWALLSVL